MPLLLSLAWRSSASRRQRSALTVLAVAIGVALILATQLTANELNQQLEASTRTLLGNADAEIFAFAAEGFSPEMVTAIRGLPEVSVSAPVVSKRVSGSYGGQSQTFDLLGVDPVAEDRLHPLELAAGSLFRSSDAGAVVLDERWAGQHGLHVGSTISLFTATGPDQFHVKGLLRNSAFVQSSYGAVVFVPLESAQKAFRLGSRVTQVSIQLNGDPATVYPRLRTDLRRAAIEEYTLRDNHAYFARQRQPFAEVQPALLFFSLLALGIGVFLIYNNLAVTVFERRREIGLLRAAGALPGWIRQLFLLQALLLGLIGSVVGVLLGLGLALLLVSYLRGLAGGPQLTFSVDAGAIGLAALLGVLTTMLAAVYPARRAAAMAPLEALRSVTGFVQERARRRLVLIGVLLLVVAAVVLYGTLAPAPTTEDSQARLALVALGILLVFAGILSLAPLLVAPLTAIVARPLRVLAPVETMLARNSLVRRPNRTALTLAGLLVSAALVVSVAGLSQGALASGTRWVDSLFVSDRLLVSPVHQSEDIRQEIGRLDGVAGTSPISFFSLRTADRAVNAAAILPLDYASRSGLDIVSGQRQTAFTELEGSRSIFISRRFAQTRKLAVGDHLLLGASGPIVAYRVAAIVAHSFPSPGGEEAVLVSALNARQDFGVEGFNVLQVIQTQAPAPDFDHSLQLDAQRFGMQLESVGDVRAGVQDGLNSLLFLLTAVGLAGVVVGLMSVVTTILLNISESTREYGLLRAVGLSRGQLNGMIVAQSSMLGLSGAVLGVLVGLGLTAVTIRAAGSTGFEPAYSVPGTTIVAVLLAAFVGSGLAVILPARRAAAQSVVAAVRYE